MAEENIEAFIKTRIGMFRAPGRFNTLEMLTIPGAIAAEYDDCAAVVFPSWSIIARDLRSAFRDFTDDTRSAVC